MISLKNILVATDFSEPSEAALRYGRELARRFGSTLHVLHVVEIVQFNTMGAGEYAAMVTDLQQQFEEDARRHLALVVESDRKGPQTVSAIRTATSAAAAIIEYAKEHPIDAIVIGTHGRGALAQLLLGSVAERVVRLAPCPVLTVRHPEREFVLPDALVTVSRA